MARLPSVSLKGFGRWIKQPAVAGQGLAQIPKFAIGLASTELGNKVYNTLIGIVGNIINENTKKSALLRSLFTNMMFTVADPTANQIRELSRNVQDLMGGLKLKSYSTAFGALNEDPQEIVSAIRSAIPKFSGFKGFKIPSLKKFKNISIGRTDAISEVTSDLVTKFTGGFDGGMSYGDPLSEDDLVEY
ncbi:hypothetical protein LCGC14_0223540 [marine sediment metagenome]|uniref:Uncharacterized protein n=1 Tax=marine sediment metagenome TaxID=412755 RepID=A0A0F9WWL7_9ZZZZ